MRLTILGHSAADGNPGQACAGFLVSSGSTRIVLDLGPGVLPRLRTETDLRTLDAIVISHLHLDHLLDLFALRYTLSYSRIRTGRRLPLWLPPGGAAFLESIGRAFAAVHTEVVPGYFSDVYDIQEFEPGRGLTINQCHLTFAPTVHYLPCWAIRVQGASEPGDLVYTADMGPASDLSGFVAGCHTLLTEASYLQPPDEPFASRGHQTAGEAGALAAAAGAKLLVLTHWTVQDDPLALARQAGTAFSGRIAVAMDGDRFDW